MWERSQFLVLVAVMPWIVYTYSIIQFGSRFPQIYWKIVEECVKLLCISFSGRKSIGTKKHKCYVAEINGSCRTLIVAPRSNVKMYDHTVLFELNLFYAYTWIFGVFDYCQWRMVFLGFDFLWCFTKVLILMILCIPRWRIYFPSIKQLRVTFFRNHQNARHQRFRWSIFHETITKQSKISCWA